LGKRIEALNNEKPEEILHGLCTPKKLKALGF